MGVDAEMFVRIKGRDKWLADADELKTAYELASTIGPSKFMNTIGMWKDEKGHHCLEIMRPIKHSLDADYHGVPATMIGRVIWSQDGDTIVAGQDEQFVRIHLYTRYYGEEYARGDWPTIRVVAEWCELRFPGCEVWYGGDSSGICAEHLSAERRDELNKFFLSSGRKSYARYDDGPDRVTGHRGTMCPVCDVRMYSTGGGQGDSFWSCDGCEQRAVILANNKIVFGKGDIFKLADEARKAA